MNIISREEFLIEFKAKNGTDGQDGGDGRPGINAELPEDGQNAPNAHLKLARNSNNQ